MERASCCCVIIWIIALAALGLGLGLYFGVFKVEDIEDITGIDTPTLPPFAFKDPFAGVPDDEMGRWRNGGSGGLSLEIKNACDDKWDAVFDQAIQDWESGTPDALSLTTSKVSPDANCDYESGLMKVCNNDYGETGWKGLNERLINQLNIITTSRALMNEYYLAGADVNEWQYTMCHEVGHGFGLPHTDESFLNPNLGNCLDYTSNVDTNLLPGAVNYEKLAEKYGTVDNNRLLEHSQHVERIPNSVLEAYTHRFASLLKGTSIELEGWTVINQSQFGAEYQTELPDGYRAAVSMLRP